MCVHHYNWLSARSLFSLAECGTIITEGCRCNNWLGVHTIVTYKTCALLYLLECMHYYNWLSVRTIITGGVLCTIVAG